MGRADAAPEIGTHGPASRQCNRWGEDSIAYRTLEAIIVVEVGRVEASSREEPAMPIRQ